MIDYKKINLSFDEIIQLKITIDKIRPVASKTYPFTTIVSLLIISVLIIFSSYFLIEYIGVFCYLIFIFIFFPLWIITITNITYFKEVLPIKKQYKLFNEVLVNKSYSAIKINSDECFYYSERFDNYYIFKNKTNLLFLRAGDFHIDYNTFPNSEITIPPSFLFSIIGNKIICTGDTLQPQEDHKITTKYMLILQMLSIGETFIINKQSN